MYIPRVMNTIYELVEALGGNSIVANHLGKPFPSTVSEMKRRGNIRVEYWPSLIELAKERNVYGVSAETLMQLHLKQQSRTTDTGGGTEMPAPVCPGVSGDTPNTSTQT